MTTVTFSSSVGGDGSTVTDDSSPTTGLAGGGHRVRFVPAMAQTVAVAANTVTKAAEASASATAAASSVTAAAASAAAAAASASSAAFLTAFPVGAIYINAVNTNPGTFLGGTWSQIAAGRTLIGVGTLGSDTYTAGATGGEARHTLSTSEMPAHGHGGVTSADGTHSHGGATSSDGAHGHDINVRSGTINNSVNPSAGYVEAGDTESPTTGVDSGAVQSAGAHTHSISADGSHTHSITSEGGGTAHENRMPYLAVYFWQRTA